MTLRPTMPDTPARRLALVAGIALIAVTFLLAVGVEIWDGRHLEWAIDRAVNDPGKWAVLFWSIGAILIAASAWWSITLGPVLAAAGWIARWVRGA